MTDLLSICRRIALAGVIGVASVQVAAQTADYIVAVVNQELVTAGELQQRLARIREDAARNRTPLPPPGMLRKQVLDTLIDERVLVTNARESGAKVDEPEIDRAVANVAQQNQLTMAQLRDRLRQEGINYAKFRDNIRDQLLVERVREREVTSRIKVSDAEIDDLVEKRRKAAGGGSEIDLAQILVSVPEGASPDVVAERRARAEAAQKRVLAGEDFATVAREVSEDGNRAQGGEIGLRPLDRLPDLFVRAAERMKPGEISTQLLRSDAGFHILKLVDRKESSAFTIDQARVRHILLRPSPELTPEAAARRLVEFKREILAGTKTFEQLARANSEDASAQQGGDLGWASPGSFVPEFEQAVDALPVGGISDPVTTRFGLHLVQVVDRRKVTLDNRQLREQARNILREQKFEQAFAEWLRDLRSRSYIELRDPPQS
jgi:peptidyl-prolyl cis-trans isomerase SurA